MHAFRTGLMVVLMAISTAAFAAETPPDRPLRVGVFAVDATPPVGSPLAYAPAKEVTVPLSCRGVVLLGEEGPIVLCAVDWIGIGNDGQKKFRESLAKAAGTSPERVAVHALHQHCAPRCDFSTDRLLSQYGINDQVFDAAFARDVIRRAAEAVAVAIDAAKPVTHLGLGQAVVENVASNRRILGPDGKVSRMRWTSPRLGDLRALPAGTIDPVLRTISLWDGNRPLVALTYYAVHPVSYSGEGEVNTEFPGIARDSRQEATGVMHVHFTGAAGNLNASKWNDGSPEKRRILADRVAAGMARAWESTTKTPIGARDLGWESLAVSLPLSPDLDEKKLLATLEDQSASISKRSPVRPASWFGYGAATRATRSTFRAFAWAKPACFICPASCSSSTSWRPRSCGQTCSSPWPPMATTAQATSAQRSPTAKAATRPVPALLTLLRESRKC